MPSPRLIIFDLDGTLIEFPHEFIFSQTERILPILEHPEIPRAELEDHFSDFDFFRFIRHPDREDFIRRFWLEFDWASHPKPIPFSWTATTLELIAGEKIGMAIATSRLDDENMIRADLEPSGWLHHFSCIRQRQGQHIAWTDKAEQIDFICRELGVAPADAILVGDVPSDIASAKSAGIGRTAAVLSGGIKRPVLEASGADFILSGINQLVRLLKTG